jgi:hypothetical protein
VEIYDRLILGTAQFGMPYGIANTEGQTSQEEVEKILCRARAIGINTLDTAMSYGESERQLGRAGVGQWEVISKLSDMPVVCKDVKGWVYESVSGSLERLKVDKLHALLIHHSHQLSDLLGSTLYQAALSLKDQNVVGKIGISVYDPGELDNLWSDYRPDLVQVPFNVLDRRMATTGWVSRLHKADTEVHARSIFLQGLLLMDLNFQRTRFNKWEPIWNQWNSWLAAEQLTPLEACLNFVLSEENIDRVVFGIESLDQLNEVISCSQKIQAVAPPLVMMTEDPDLINPTNW